MGQGKLLQAVGDNTWDLMSLARSIRLIFEIFLIVFLLVVKADGPLQCTLCVGDYCKIVTYSQVFGEKERSPKMLELFGGVSWGKPNQKTQM